MREEEEEEQGPELRPALFRLGVSTANQSPSGFASGGYNQPQSPAVLNQSPNFMSESHYLNYVCIHFGRCCFSTKSHTYLQTIGNCSVESRYLFPFYIIPQLSMFHNQLHTFTPLLSLRFT
jgi:hypothetical protein